MTATSEERREVAERLRKCGAELSILGADCETGFHVIDKVIGCREEDSWERFLARLADLIDPTCEVKDDNRWTSDFAYVCRACGEHFSTCDKPNYCPGCGARVVEGSGD